MALDKNDGVFLPSIEGVVSGKTSQVDGMNGIMNNLIGNDNYLKDKKLDRGNYVGSGELLSKDDKGIWGGEYGGKIQDPIPKELNKRYIDNINGKAFICIKAGDSSVVSNTIEYFTPCNVVDNLAKLQNLFSNIGGDLVGMRLGPFIINVGKVGTSSSDTVKYNFPIPYTERCFGVIANSENETTNVPIAAAPISLTQFRVRAASGTPAAYVVAIGI